MLAGAARIVVVAPVLASLAVAAPARAAPVTPLPPASAPPSSQAGGGAPVPGGLVPPPAPAGPSPVPPTADGATPPSLSAPGDAGPTAVPPESVLVPRVVPTGDVSPFESDHDAVLGAWGVEVRSVTTTLPVFNRRASTGCPVAASSVDCPAVAVGMLSIRHWVNRNLGLNAGAALAFGGGTEGDRLLDTYFGIGPTVGVSVLLGNWRHLSVAASPGFSLVWFKPAGSAPAAAVADLRADLEGELHFGFIGVPALSLGIRSGMVLRLEKAAAVTMWSAGVSGATTLRGLVTDLAVRYYF